MKISSAMHISLILLGLFPLASLAGVKMIEADSAYIMGDNDSKIDARRIATQEAKRKALELAGTFVASLTQVKEYKLSKDEVTAYTAGVVETEVVNEEWKGSSAHPEVYIKARCKIDTDVLMNQIDRYRESEELREQLEASAKETEALKKERDDLQKQLAAEKDKAKAEETRKKLDTVLTKEETIDDTNRVWARLSPKMNLYGETGEAQGIGQADLENSALVLQRAVKVNPRNQRARVLLASIYQERGDRAAAESELRAAIAANPSNPLLHMKLGVLLKEQGRYDEALKEFHFVERRRPNEPHMLFLVGTTHKAEGNCRLAVAYLKRFLKFTQRNDGPRIVKMKDRAREVIMECGDRPKRERVRQRLQLPR